MVVIVNFGLFFFDWAGFFCLVGLVYVIWSVMVLRLKNLVDW